MDIVVFITFQLVFQPFKLFFALVYALIYRCLERCTSLEHLELTYPQEMSARTLEALYKLKLRVLRMPGTKVLEFPAVVPPIQELSCLSLTPPCWAFSGPFNLVTTYTGSSN